ncbi:hypothetical protein LCGC14_2082000 [marine sediment metagenome]|uniref:Uncharacterized protein n=1 Tax=marine sediment metagenome TaxID=412755 RepID=A0A0F9GTL9_9ZZZZ
MIKIRAKPGDVLFFLLYDIVSYSHWRKENEEYPDHAMQCKAVGIFKALHKDSVIVHSLELLDDEDKHRKKLSDTNATRQIPLGIIKEYKNLGRVLDWPKLETKP